MRGRRVAFPLGLLAIACLCMLVAYLNRHSAAIYPGSGQEFASGWTAYAPVQADQGPNRFEAFDLWDPLLWFGAGFAFMCAGFAAYVRALPSRRRGAERVSDRPEA